MGHVTFSVSLNIMLLHWKVQDCRVLQLLRHPHSLPLSPFSLFPVFYVLYPPYPFPLPITHAYIINYPRAHYLITHDSCENFSFNHVLFCFISFIKYNSFIFYKYAYIHIYIKSRAAGNVLRPHTF